VFKFGSAEIDQVQIQLQPNWIFLKKKNELELELSSNSSIYMAKHKKKKKKNAIKHHESRNRELWHRNKNPLRKWEEEGEREKTITKARVLKIYDGVTYQGSYCYPPNK
jgi:uncharacterized protein with WD repeat